jgi:predicted ester cyclase
MEMVAMSEELKAIAARMPTEVFNEGRLDVIDEVMAPDFVDHGLPPGMSNDREGVKAFAAAAREAFPDLVNTVTHVVAEGDLVCQHVSSTGTMRGDFAGMQASGKQATWEAIHLMRFRGKQAVEHWVVSDQLGMLQQLGFIEMPTGRPA